MKKAVIVLLLSVLFVSCRTEVKYETYKESGYREDTLSRKAFIEDYWTCEKHQKRMYKTIVSVYYGFACGGFMVPDSIPNAYSRPDCGGCVKRQGAPQYSAIAYCSKCQKEFRKHKRRMRTN